MPSIEYQSHCFFKGNSMMARPQKQRRLWTLEEDKKLIDFMIKRAGRQSWTGIAALAGLKKRTDKSCWERWNYYLKPGVNQAYFSQEEDDTIIHLHRVYGNKWATMAENALLRGRSPNVIKNRYNNHLKKKHGRSTHQNIPDTQLFHPNQNIPNASSISSSILIPVSDSLEIGNLTFSQVEDHLIILLHQFYGNRWADIATHLPGRTDNDIKNRWDNHLERLATSTHQNIPDTQHFHLNQNLPDASSISTPISASQEIADPWSNVEAHLKFIGEHLLRDEETIHHSFEGHELVFDVNSNYTNFEGVSASSENEFMPTEEVTRVWST